MESSLKQSWGRESYNKYSAIIFISQARDEAIMEKVLSMWPKDGMETTGLMRDEAGGDT